MRSKIVVVDVNRIPSILLQTFLTVAEAGQVSEAARRLHLSQPTVTGHIRRLEANLETTPVHTLSQWSVFKRARRPSSGKSSNQVLSTHIRHHSAEERTRRRKQFGQQPRQWEYFISPFVKRPLDTYGRLDHLIVLRFLIRHHP
jgi:hypothetical protein